LAFPTAGNLKKVSTPDAPSVLTERATAFPNMGNPSDLPRLHFANK
jgi:hypothetical protein